MKLITIFLLSTLILLESCKREPLISTHGIAYLDKREKLILVKVSNKNDTISVLGQPSSRGLTNDNLWIYIERTSSRGKLLKLGQSHVTKNNVLVLEFDKYGVLQKKEFYNKDDMKRIKFAKTITENDLKKKILYMGFYLVLDKRWKPKRNKLTSYYS